MQINLHGCFFIYILLFIYMATSSIQLNMFSNLVVSLLLHLLYNECKMMQLVLFMGVRKYFRKPLQNLLIPFNCLKKKNDFARGGSIMYFLNKELVREHWLTSQNHFCLYRWKLNWLNSKRNSDIFA